MERTNVMRTVTKAILALGFVGAMAVGTAEPSAAQNYYYSSPGVRVYVDPGYEPRYRSRYYRNDRYYDDRYAYAPRRGAKASNGCPPHYTVQDGRCKPYRGY
jgi:hypothetical protein